MTSRLMRRAGSSQSRTCAVRPFRVLSVRGVVDTVLSLQGAAAARTESQNLLIRVHNPRMTERILDLTLEVNYLLTGEDCIVMKRPGESVQQSHSPGLSDGSDRAQSPSTVSPPHSLIHDGNNEQKVLKLTNQIIHLLTGEVWEYLERHKELYNDVVTDTRRPVCPLGKRRFQQCVYV
ncbi:Hypothetical predicted protein [Pelobates cultripes]|uniref:Uncharacterized protein n=1 Tax=Pelobates cultripes TaxID=61616 RepID=A0AAD1W2B9_PELCU|nr:Hypothetical predicted protein [Pelobates cultripes]